MLRPTHVATSEILIHRERRADRGVASPGDAAERLVEQDLDWLIRQDAIRRQDAEIEVVGVETDPFRLDRAQLECNVRRLGLRLLKYVGK